MRVAILAPGYGWSVRGVEVFIHDLVARLVRRRPDWQFDIFTLAPSGRPSKNVRLVHVPAFSRYSAAARIYASIGHRVGIYLRTPISAECLSFTLSLTPRIWRSTYDVVFNQAGWFGGRLLSAKRLRDGTPFVHKTAGGYSHAELMLAQQQPDLLFATSPFVRDWLLGNVPGLRCEYVPEAVDARVFTPGPSSHKPCAVLFAGAMTEMKRPDLTVRAVAATKDLSLRMIGDGELRDQIAKMGNELLGHGRFELVRRVNNDDMPEYYRATRLFTLASDEPFGIVFLEAMACNVPIVGRNTPVTTWLADGAGVTGNCVDVQEYAAMLCAASAQDFANRPRQRALEFDWELVADAYEACFAVFS